MCKWSELRLQSIIFTKFQTISSVCKPSSRKRSFEESERPLKVFQERFPFKNYVLDWINFSFSVGLASLSWWLDSKGSLFHCRLGTGMMQATRSQIIGTTLSDFQALSQSSFMIKIKLSKVRIWITLRLSPEGLWNWASWQSRAWATEKDHVREIESSKLRKVAKLKSGKIDCIV